MKIKLGLLPTDRLRRLLDAFAVQIHHDIRTDQVTFHATISEHAVPHIPRLTRTTTGRSPADSPHTSTNDAAPANDGGGSDHLQFCDVQPTCQQTNPKPIIEGPELMVAATHTKVRRDGYRK
jgi:site-specific DNA recombinase